METRLPPLSLFPRNTQKLQSWEKQFLDPPVLVSLFSCCFDVDVDVGASEPIMASQTWDGTPN